MTAFFVIIKQLSIFDIIRIRLLLRFHIQTMVKFVPFLPFSELYNSTANHLFLAEMCFTSSQPGNNIYEQFFQRSGYVVMGIWNSILIWSWVFVFVYLKILFFKITQFNLK